MTSPLMSCNELLDRSSVIHLPRELATAYRNELDRRGLLQAAVVGSIRGHIHGGETPAETLQHFAHRFGNSASRIACVMIDPARCFASLPMDLLKSFSSHKIAVLDAACGTGASLLSLLTVLRTVRQARLVPQLPLTVSVVGADISTTALEIYSSIVDELAPPLAELGIAIELDTEIWDASKVNETSGLCDAWLSRHSDANEYLLLVSNLSGVADAVAESFQRSFTHLTERISNIPSPVLWVEPSVSPRITKRILKVFSLSWWLSSPGFSGRIK